MKRLFVLLSVSCAFNVCADTFFGNQVLNEEPSEVVNQKHKQLKSDFVIIDTSTKLRRWCKHESSASLTSKNIELYNFSASTWVSGNRYISNVYWRTDDEPFYVRCSAVKGVSSKYASMDVSHEPFGALSEQLMDTTR